MAKIHIKRIAEKLGIPESEVRGGNYRKLIGEVINQNTRNIGRAVGRLTNNSYDKQIEKLRKKGRLKEKRVLLPALDDVLPKRSVSVRKAAVSGREISQTLSDRLTKAMRDTMRGFQDRGQAFELGAGRGAGKINPELIAEFEKNVRGVFSTYTRRDPDLGVPSNVKQIAVTEIRSTLDDTKAAYHKQLAEKNPDTIRMTKTWVQNRALARNPRPEHTAVDGVTIEVDKEFRVPNPNGGYDYMAHPHAPGAPAEQVIGCNCDAVYKAILL